MSTVGTGRKKVSCVCCYDEINKIHHWGYSKPLTTEPVSLRLADWSSGPDVIHYLHLPSQLVKIKFSYKTSWPTFRYRFDMWNRFLVSDPITVLSGMSLDCKKWIFIQEWTGVTIENGDHSRLVMCLCSWS